MDYVSQLYEYSNYFYHFELFLSTQTFPQNEEDVKVVHGYSLLYDWMGKADPTQPNVVRFNDQFSEYDSIPGQNIS